MGIEAADEIGHCGATAKAGVTGCLGKRMTLLNGEQGGGPSDLIHAFALSFGRSFQTGALVFG